MPKLKTKKGAKKRFKITSNGKIKYKRAFLRHIMTTKNRKRKRHLGKAATVHKADQRNLMRTMPYS